jgi:hypothetical protein
VFIKEDVLCSRIVDIDGVAIKAINLSILYERYNLKDPFIKIDLRDANMTLLKKSWTLGLNSAVYAQRSINLWRFREPYRKAEITWIMHH